MMSFSDNGDDERGVISDAERREFKERLDKLGGKLGEVRGEAPKTETPEARGKAMGTAFRMSAEMIAGVVVGGLLGYAIDAGLGSKPLALIVGLLFGAGVGIYNAIRSAKAMQSKL
ncbi:MAG: AtpZ/AtpI family protein [Hyphomicrobiales bacterium]|nr:AtpZ/AtpI family protein [Hyphomicrobiales bacterium]